MKTTIDLPEELVQQMKIRAVQERKPLKRLAADLLFKGLNERETPAPVVPEALPPEITLNERGYPVIRCGTKAPAAQMTVEELLLLEQQTLKAEDLQRSGLAH